MSNDINRALQRYECPECGLIGNVVDDFDTPRCKDCGVFMKLIESGDNGNE